MILPYIIIGLFVFIIVACFVAGIVASALKGKKIELEQKTRAINEVLDVQKKVEERRNDPDDLVRKRLQDYIRDRNR